MQRLRLLVFAIVAMAFGLEAFLFFAPVPGSVVDVQQFRTQLTSVTSFSIFYFAAAILFLYGMHEFKPEMRRSYLIITASMAFFGFVNLQYPLLLYAGFIPGPWLWYGGSMLVIIPGVIMHYWGVRHVARTLKLANKPTSVIFLVTAMAITSGAVILLPHVREIPEFWFAVHQFAAVANFILNLFSMFILLPIVRNVGASYQPAFRWLAASVAVSTIGFAHIIIAALFGQNNTYGQSGITAVPFIVVSLLYAVSGYYFCKVRLYGQSAAEATTPGRDILDAVVSTASLVSDSNEIDVFLDGVRDITIRLEPGAPLAPDDARRLAHIYLQLEGYLLHGEKLKNFTRDGLRARLSPEALQLVQAEGVNSPFAYSGYKIESLTSN